MRRKIAGFVWVPLLALVLCGCSPFLHKLHREKGVQWENGIEAEYAEWKISLQEQVVGGRPKVRVVWRALIRNTTDEPKKLTLIFRLFDRENFQIGFDMQGESGFLDEHMRDALTPLVFTNPQLAQDLADTTLIHLPAHGEGFINGRFYIDKEAAPTAHKGTLELRT